MTSLAFVPHILRHPTLRTSRARFFCTAAPAPLYLVSTPIGNPLDITLRAQKILSAADTVAAEDTRTARVLLRTLQTPERQSLISCHEHNWASRIPTILSRLQSGRSVALVSDAGTPCVSDPGLELVQAAVQAGITVVPVPGACAALAALVASGLPISAFEFLGFVPRSGKARRATLDNVLGAKSTVLLYEAPHRIASTLRDLADLETDDRRVCLAREVTKKWEQFLRFDSLNEAANFYESGTAQPRGEYTMVIAPAIAQPVERHDLNAYSSAEVNVVALVEALAHDGVPVRNIARCVAGASRVPKKLIYAYATSVKNSAGPHHENTTG